MNSELEERVGITASFENVSERNNTLHVMNTNDGTGRNTLDKVSEFSVPRTHFDRKSHIHHANNTRRDPKMKFSSQFESDTKPIKLIIQWLFFIILQ